MSNTGYIPSADESFHAWQANFALKLGPMVTRIGIPAAKMTTFESLQGLWIDAFQLASQPSTRTPLAIEQKKHARDDYEAHIRALVRQYITHNDATTDDDRVSLGLPIPKTTRTPVPVPADSPAFEVGISHLREIHIYYHPTGAKPAGAKPYGVHGAECCWAIRDTPPTDDIETDLPYSRFDTHSPLILPFKEGQRGKTVYFALRWENTRGDKGPWGDIGSAIIP
ncbi:hypothetical protein Ga0100231_021545 [Opitutaceae bacterium TAV4]|uniref:hypothetical protein n=1 Tax=Geminisphaera colitermitum TaxID=1148786 RepID=UPI000158C9CE|nr:hypothetical protein [Geminisphaera colitermitum]RRJ96449.1 hypothetical protein Ga0100231_021545 [Opitutaceae bacterium TAV4]RRJ99787.1 hypothetical protein Ga0100230_017165 [Opitutaceae bacterium TAV3]